MLVWLVDLVRLVYLVYLVYLVDLVSDGRDEMARRTKWTKMGCKTSGKGKTRERIALSSPLGLLGWAEIRHCHTWETKTRWLT